jgi:phosphomannomutase
MEDSKMTEKRLPAFKAYDIRGTIPLELNEEMVYKIGRAYAAEIHPTGSIAICRDIRKSSASLAAALINGLNDAGVDTIDIGIGGTEMMYFAASLEGMGGGIMITASHNPKDYNGLKLVGNGSVPIGEDSGLLNIERRVRTGDVPPSSHKGASTHRDIMDKYINCVLSFIDVNTFKPMKIVANAGNGCAGPVLDALAPHLPFDFTRIYFEPDGEFPNGVPNPLLPENRAVTTNGVRNSHAGLGIAWDGDFDRCFFFDENGNFVEGYYLVGFLAKRILQRNPNAPIVHDPRLIWNTIEIVRAAGGIPVVSKSGHTFIKETMRETCAVYGGEMSAHHYFREFCYSDSGMISWLLVAEEISAAGQNLGELVQARIEKYPCSGEINRKVKDPDTVLKRVEENFSVHATTVSHLDGVSMEFGRQWRFNLRKSNTEPVVRLNVESTKNDELMKSKTEEILCLIEEIDA